MLASSLNDSKSQTKHQGTPMEPLTQSHDPPSKLSQPQDNGPIILPNHASSRVDLRILSPSTLLLTLAPPLLCSLHRLKTQLSTEFCEGKKDQQSKMLKKEISSGSGGGGWSRVCDSCRSAACAVYCRVDMAYLCAGCDARIHAANQMASRHERVWVCEACERAPAAFTCKADAASLCTTCDADIHSANPLARRHHRVPILPISGCLYGPSANYPTIQLGSIADMEDGFLAPEVDEEVEEEDDETSSWLLLNPVKNNHQSNGFLFGGDDEYLDLEEYNSCSENQYQDPYNQQQQQQPTSFPDQQNQMKNDGSDSVVPVQYGTMDHHNQQNLHLEMDYGASKSEFNYTASMSHSVSMSSMDTSIVPDSTMSEISNVHSRTPKGTIDLFSSPPLQMPAQFSPMDREARVLRYREKRKTRKFEKTIRYASRKAYAETRPRIKGRFAKRTDVEVEVDQMFATSVMADNGYSIVPSF